jgi:hypothetical protein
MKIRSIQLRQGERNSTWEKEMVPDTLISLQNAVSLKEEFVYSGIDEPVCMMIPAGQANAGTNPKRLLTPLFF